MNNPIAQIQNNLFQSQQLAPLAIDQSLLQTNVQQSALVSQLQAGSTIASLRVMDQSFKKMEDLPDSNQQEQLIKILANKAGIYTVQQLAQTAERQQLTSIKALPEADRRLVADTFYLRKTQQHIQWLKDVLIIASGKKGKEYSLSMWFFDILAFCQYDFDPRLSTMLRNVQEKKIPAKSTIPGSEYIYQLLTFLTSEKKGPQYWYVDDQVLFNSILLVLAPFTKRTQNQEEQACAVFSNMKFNNKEYHTIREKHDAFLISLSEAIGIDLTGVVALMNDKGSNLVQDGSEDVKNGGDPMDSKDVKEISFGDPSQWIYCMDYLYKSSSQHLTACSIWNFYSNYLHKWQRDILRTFVQRVNFSSQWWVLKEADILASDLVLRTSDWTDVPYKEGKITYHANTIQGIKEGAYTKEYPTYFYVPGRNLYHLKHPDPSMTKPRFEWKSKAPAEDFPTYHENVFWRTKDIRTSIETLYLVGLIGCVDITAPNLSLADLYSPARETQIKYLGFSFDFYSPYKMDSTLSKFLSDANNAFPTFDMREKQRVIQFTDSESKLAQAQSFLSANPNNQAAEMAFLTMQTVHRNNQNPWWDWIIEVDTMPANQVFQAIKVFRQAYLQLQKSRQQGFIYYNLIGTYGQIFADLLDGDRIARNGDFMESRNFILEKIRAYVDVEYSTQFQQIVQLFSENLKVFNDASQMLSDEKMKQSEMINQMNSHSRGIWKRQATFLEDTLNASFENKYKLTDNFFFNNNKVSALRDLMIDNIGLSMGSQSGAHAVIQYIKEKQVIPSENQLRELVSNLQELKQVSQINDKMPTVKEFDAVKKRSIPVVSNRVIGNQHPSYSDLLPVTLNIKKDDDRKVLQAMMADPEHMPFSSSVAKKKNKKKPKNQSKPKKPEKKDSDTESEDESGYSRQPHIRKVNPSSNKKQAGAKSMFSSQQSSAGQSEAMETHIVQKPNSLLQQATLSLQHPKGWQGKFGSLCPRGYVNVFGQTYNEVLKELGIPNPQNKKIISDGKDPQIWMSPAMLNGSVSPAPMLQSILAWAPKSFHLGKQQFRNGKLDISKVQQHLSSVVQRPVVIEAVPNKKRSQSKKKEPEVIQFEKKPAAPSKFKNSELDQLKKLVNDLTTLKK